MTLNSPIPLTNVVFGDSDTATAGSWTIASSSTANTPTFAGSTPTITVNALGAPSAMIAILATLMALLLPAVQAARESARRTQCGNNARQLGLGCQTYASTHGGLSPGGDESPRAKYGLSWIGWILPQLEQAAIYDKLDLIGVKASEGSTGWVGQNHHNGEVLRGVRIPPLFYCPSSDLPALVVQPQGAHLISGSMFTGIAGAIDDVTAQRKLGLDRAEGYVARVDVVMADGSTRFLNDSIEFQVLCNLANRKDGKVIGASDF